jgi:hypothetical protein
VLETCRELKIKINTYKKLRVTLVIYPESLHDARSTKCRIETCWSAKQQSVKLILCTLTAFLFVLTGEVPLSVIDYEMVGVVFY